MNLMELVIAGILFVVLGFVLTIGQNITSQNTQNICTGVLGNTWISNNSGGSMALRNPLDGTFMGCCTTVNASSPGECTVWRTNSYAINSSYYAASGINTLAYWLPIIALAMAAGFVIAILITYLLGSVVGKQSASI